MCGLAGSFTQIGTKLTQKQRLRRARVIEGLLVANAARGTDATGVATICGDDRCIVKNTKPSYEFVDQVDARKAVRTNAPLIIGHTRFGTHGGNEVKNAHPFEEGNVVGAHNGVISNYAAIDAAVRDAKKVDTKDWDHVAVDSQAVFRLLDHAGPEDYLEALEKVTGSMALTWHDKRTPNSLWMVAHNNPLNLAWVPGIDTLFWSSQYDHLTSVMWSVYGQDWLTIPIKDDFLYLFNGNNVRVPESWKLIFPITYSSAYSGSGYGGYSSQWPDDDEDGDVQHPYAIATVSRKDESGGKAQASPTTEEGLENVVSVINRMGLPWVSESESAIAAPIPESTLVEDFAGWTDEEPAPFDDLNCSVCMESIEDGAAPARYFKTTGQWVCESCFTFWNAEGQGNLLEAMGHA